MFDYVRVRVRACASWLPTDAGLGAAPSSTTEQPTQQQPQQAAQPTTQPVTRQADGGTDGDLHEGEAEVGEAKAGAAMSGDEYVTTAGDTRHRKKSLV